MRLPVVFPPMARGPGMVIAEICASISYRLIQVNRARVRKPRVLLWKPRFQACPKQKEIDDEGTRVSRPRH